MAVTSIYAGALLSWLPQQFLTALGAPAANYRLFSYEAGTSTKLRTCTTANLSADHANPIVMSSDGRPPSPIWVLPQGYKFVFAAPGSDDPPSSAVWTVDLYEDIGSTFGRNLGNIQSAGSKSVASGYTILSTDRLITVNGAASPSIINLLAASASPMLLTIKNVGTNALAITPNGSDVIEGSASAYSVPASSGVTQPAITILSDGVSAWYVIASHKVP